MPADAVSVDVVVPTWNRLDLLRDCLTSLRAQTRSHQVYVVDNGSTDGTAGALARDFPEVEVLALQENLGFGRAVNRGIVAGSGALVVLLNNDTIAPPEFLELLLRPFAGDPGLASTAGVLLDPDGVTVDAAGVVVDTSLAGYSHLHGQPLSDVPAAPEPLGPCGGAAAYRRGVLVELGGFDPEIFAYGEDVDLAVRAQRAGHRCVVATGAHVLHRGGATLGQGTPAQLGRAGWSRGYLLGRYRVSRWVVAVEAVIGAVSAVQSGSTLPMTERLRGWRHGRSLTAKPWDSGIAALTLTQGLKRRALA